MTNLSFDADLPLCNRSFMCRPTVWAVFLLRKIRSARALPSLRYATEGEDGGFSVLKKIKKENANKIEKTARFRFTFYKEYGKISVTAVLGGAILHDLLGGTQYNFHSGG